MRYLPVLVGLLLHPHCGDDESPDPDPETGAPSTSDSTTAASSTAPTMYRHANSARWITCSATRSPTRRSR